jgi:Zn-dependent protease
MLHYNIATILVNIPITLIALTGHEFAHGYVSSKQGDPTPRMQGRLTLNPRYYKNQKKGMALTAAAGPLANLIMAFLALLIYAIIAVVFYKLNIAQGRVLSLIGSFAQLFAVRNLCFMIFNIIPIPPLDGAKVLGMFLPDRTYYKMLQYERYFMILIMLLSLSGFFSGIIGTGVNVVMSGILKLLNAGISLVL